MTERPEPPAERAQAMRAHNLGITVRYADDPKEYMRQYRRKRADQIRAVARAYRTSHRQQERDRQNKWWPIKKARMEAKRRRGGAGGTSPSARRVPEFDAIASSVANDCLISESLARQRIAEIGIRPRPTLED